MTSSVLGRGFIFLKKWDAPKILLHLSWCAARSFGEILIHKKPQFDGGEGESFFSETNYIQLVGFGRGFLSW